MAPQLAMFGGPRTVTRRQAQCSSVAWPIVTDAERQAVLRVVDAGRFTSVGAGGHEVSLLEQEWARYTGAAHCVGVANGTAAIELALAALGIEPGAEVLVPALSFIASAVAPVRRLLVPVFVDVNPATFNIDPAAAAAAITGRTQAILAVHLHGLPCDMAELEGLAGRRRLLLVEDAAQAHGASYRGRYVGTLGQVAAFSLNASKNLPTCGEGGLVTTQDPAMRERVLLHRQFGEDLSGDREYLSRVLAGNEKLSTVNAAFARCQLRLFPERQQAREANVRALLGRLSVLPGLIVPHCPADRTHAWHMLRLRFDVEAMGYQGIAPGAMRTILQRALRAEGVPVQQYQRLPLPGQPALRDRAGFGGYPWRLPGVPERGRYRAADYPGVLTVLEDSLTLQRWHLNPASMPVLDRCADAFEKVWQHRDQLAAIARSVEYVPAWRSPDTLGQG
jgi:dTDP-4-amino-4,6-dideoxygalactose transaminase